MTRSFDSNRSSRVPMITAGMCIAMASMWSSEIAQANSLTKAVTGGKPKVDFRLRWEGVAQDGMDSDASAVTARTRIGYESGLFMGASGFFEFENTTAAIDDYAYPGVNVGKFPVVADPEGTEVNQAYLAYTKDKLISAKLGRQRIIFDGARFVGNVGWRQNEQTYDGLLASSKAISDVTVKYAYLTGINNIFGDSVDFDTQLANITYSGLPGAKISAYGYFLDFDTGSDSKTLGASIDGKVSKLIYRAEFAQLSDYADNDSGNSANYYNVEAGTKISGVTAKLGYEVLGGDGTTSFQTPLATKHKFNGWADKFLSTPSDGLVDTYLTIVGKVSGVKLLGTYHMFSADNGSSDYGQELDLLAVKKFGKNFSAGVKYANYMADTVSVDTSKVWVWTGIKF